MFFRCLKCSLERVTRWSKLTQNAICFTAQPTRQQQSLPASRHQQRRLRLTRDHSGALELAFAIEQLGMRQLNQSSAYDILFPGVQSLCLFEPALRLFDFPQKHERTPTISLSTRL